MSSGMVTVLIVASETQSTAKRLIAVAKMRRARWSASSSASLTMRLVKFAASIFTSVFARLSQRNKIPISI